MPKFKVTTSYVNYQYAEIDADNLEQAEELARDMDGGSFTPIATDDWKIERVEEMPDALTEEQAGFFQACKNADLTATTSEIVEYFKKDADAFIQKHGTATYTKITDAWLIWLNALNYADKKARG